MIKHDYTPEQALELLMRKLNARDRDLAAEVQDAVNAGKDTQDMEQAPGKRKPRYYRRAAPYSPEEALDVAVRALAAHFIEQPLFVNSFLDNMSQAAIGVVEASETSPHSEKRTVKSEGIGSQKRVEIELYTERQLLGGTQSAVRQGVDTQPMGHVPDDAISEQQANLERLRELVDFAERH